MKLLGWVHRKFRQNNNEPFKDLVIGHSCNSLSGHPALDDQQNHQKPSHGPKHLKQGQKDYSLQKSFTGLEAARVDEEYEEESSAALSEIFQGFLAIGTLGSEQAITYPSTPTFAVSVENITEKESEVTENELKLINDELEKELGAETKEDCSNDSSGRNSYVSNGRSSHGSTITLSGKPLEAAECNGNGTATCPLQEYLFGSPTPLSETTTVARKENRTSLGELFQRTKLTEENSGGKCEREDKRTEREPEKSTMHQMKKKLKRRMLHASSRSSVPACGGPADSGLAETKLHKILHMFHRKVHPENSTSSRMSAKHEKNEDQKKCTQQSGHNTCDLTYPYSSITSNPKRDLSKKNKSQPNLPQFIEGSDNSAGNKENWIKTDADYLVLEL